MRALVRAHSLPQLAASANREHLACEAAYGTAIEHAFRAGEHLLAAKAQVAHGAWLPWLEANFGASERTAQGYMQIAREGPQRVADASVRQALATLAVPRVPVVADDAAAEVVDAEPVAEPVPEPAPFAGGPDVVDLIRTAGGLHEAEQDLAEVDARRARERFPRAGVEATTVRQIRESLRRGERMFVETMRAGHAGIGDWSCGQGLAAAATQYRDAADALAELAKTLDRKAREV